MNEKVIIIGKSGSGKNFLMDGLVKLGLKPCVKCTTRPKRNKEVNGVDYFFLSKEDFLKKIESDDMITYETFNVLPLNSEPEIWYYGIEKEQYIDSDVVILTPNEYDIFSNITDRGNLFVVYLDIDRNIRKQRIKMRDDSNDSVDRRLDSDDEDFLGFTDYDLRITDPDFGPEDVYNLII